jgi:hypothetical protein
VQVHDEKFAAGIGADVVQRGDVRMIQRRHGVRFAAQAYAAIFFGLKTRAARRAMWDASLAEKGLSGLQADPDA